MIIVKTRHVDYSWPYSQESMSKEDILKKFNVTFDDKEETTIFNPRNDDEVHELICLGLFHHDDIVNW